MGVRLLANLALLLRCEADCRDGTAECELGGLRECPSQGSTNGDPDPDDDSLLDELSGDFALLYDDPPLDELNCDFALL